MSGHSSGETISRFSLDVHGVYYRELSSQESKPANLKLEPIDAVLLPLCKNRLVISQSRTALRTISSFVSSLQCSDCSSVSSFVQVNRFSPCASLSRSHSARQSLISAAPRTFEVRGFNSILEDCSIGLSISMFFWSPCVFMFKRGRRIKQIKNARRNYDRRLLCLCVLVFTSRLVRFRVRVEFVSIAAHTSAGYLCRQRSLEGVVGE